MSREYWIIHLQNSIPELYESVDHSPQQINADEVSASSFQVTLRNNNKTKKQPSYQRKRKTNPIHRLQELSELNAKGRDKSLDWFPKDTLMTFRPDTSQTDNVVSNEKRNI